MGLKSLTRRHKQFCLLYALGESRGNASESYRLAGFSSKEPRKDAYKLLQNDIIRKELSDIYRQQDITNERIIAEYMNIIEDSEGRNADKRAALADLAKIKGMMVDKQEITTSTSLVDTVIHSLSTDKVVKIA